MLNKIMKMGGENPSEEKLAYLADTAFLNLWAYPNIYRDEGILKNGIGQEVCDILIVFGKNVIIFSDKNIKFNNEKELSVAWKRWFKRSIVESINQLYGAENFIKNHPSRLFLDKECKIPFPVSIDKGVKVFLVAVTDNSVVSAKKYYNNYGAGSAGSLINSFFLNVDDCYENPFMVGDLYPDKTFVHIFDEENLNVIFENLNTISDFINYLSAKEECVRSGRLLLSAGEECTLGLYLINDGKFYDKKRISSDEKLIIPETMWSEYETSSFASLNSAYRHGSLFWDELIRRFGDAILNAEVALGKNNDFLSHEIAVRELASENRYARYFLAKNFVDKLNQTPMDRRSSRIMESPENKGKFFMIILLPRVDNESNEEYRNRRFEMIHAYMLVAKYKYTRAGMKNVEKMIIIATEPKQSDIRSEDLVAFDFRNWTLNKNEKDMAKNLMEKDRILSDLLFESTSSKKFVEVSKREDKIGRNEKCPCGSGKKYKLCHGV